MSIVKRNPYSTGLLVHDSGSGMRGYFKDAHLGQLAGRDLVDYDQNKSYTIKALYINNADQLVISFVEGDIGVNTIDLLFKFPENDCQADIEVTDLTLTTSDYTATNTELYDILNNYIKSNVDVYITLN